MTQVLMLLGVLVICVIVNRIAEWRAEKQFKKENYTYLVRPKKEER